ncbi:hypothetical protein KBB27_01825 [Patescibacteria group bacterium]|nr:hypothetical protein [Patescibacteria group bacterium]
MGSSNTRRSPSKRRFPFDPGDVGELSIKEGEAFPAFVESVHVQGVWFVYYAKDSQDTEQVGFVRKFLSWGKDFDFETTFPKKKPEGYGGFLIKIIGRPQEEWCQIKPDSREAYALERYLSDHPDQTAFTSLLAFLKADVNISEEDLVRHAHEMTKDLRPEYVIPLIVAPPARDSSRAHWNRRLASIICEKYISTDDRDRYLQSRSELLRAIKEGGCFQDEEGWLNDPLSKTIVRLEQRIGHFQKAEVLGRTLINLPVS